MNFFNLPLDYGKSGFYPKQITFSRFISLISFFLLLANGALAQGKEQLYDLGADSHYGWSIAPDATFAIRDFSESMRIKAVDTCTLVHEFQFDYCDLDDGSIHVEVSGGSGDYSYLWDNGETGSTISNLPAGNYHVSIYDGSCVVEDSVKMDIPVVLIPEWQKKHDGDFDSHEYDMQLCSDGGLIQVGKVRTQASTGYERKIWVAKTDEAGNLQWEHTYGDGENNAGKKIITTPDGGYLIAGTTNLNPDDFLTVIKIDASGVVEWKHDFDSESNTGINPFYLGNAVDGYMVVGAGNNKLWAAKIDSGGGVAWEHVVSDSWDIGGSTGTLVGDGYVFAGEKYSNSHLVLSKMDFSGNSVWTREFEFKTSSPVITATSDGGYLVGGTFERNYHFFRKFSGDSTTVWMKRFDSYKILTSLRESVDGGYLALSGNWGDEHQLTKLTTTGDISWVNSFPITRARTFVELPDDAVILGEIRNGPVHDFLLLTKFTKPYVHGDFFPEEETVCEGYEKNYSVDVPGNEISSVVWEDGSTNFSRDVLLSSDTTIYAIAETVDGCEIADFSIVKAHPMDPMVIETIPHHCGREDGSILIHFSRANHTVLWEDGSTEFEYEGLDAGDYTVTISDEYCDKEMSIPVGEWEAPIGRTIYEGFMEQNITPPWITTKAMAKTGDGHFLALTYSNYNDVRKISYGGSLAWEIDFEENISDVFVLNDSTYLFGSRFPDKTYKYTSNGQFIEEYDFPLGKVISGGDSIYYSMYRKNGDVVLNKLDGNYNLIWSKTYGGSGFEKPISFVVNNDKLVVLASSWSDDGDLPGNNGKGDIWVFEIDPDGNLLHSANYGGSENDSPQSLAIFPDGRVAVSAYTNSGDYGVPNPGFWMLITDADLGLIGSKGFEKTAREEYVSNPNSIVKLHDGHILFVANSALYEMDESGNVLWQNNYGDRKVSLKGIHEVSDGWYVYFAHERWAPLATKKQFRMAKINFSGITEWDMNMPTIENPEYAKILFTDEKDFVLPTPFYYYEPNDDPPFFGMHYNWLGYSIMRNGEVPPDITLPSDSILCEGDTVHIDLGDFPGFTVNWSNGVEGTEVDLTQPGNYTATIRSASACENTDDIFLDLCEPYSFDTLDVGCGIVQLDAGFAGMEYDWSTGYGGQIINVYESDSVSVTVWYPDGSAVSSTAWIEVPENDISVDYEIIQPHQGGNDGSLNPFVTGGTPPYDIQWDVEDISHLPAGDYTITVTDAYGCVFTETVTLEALVGIETIEGLSAVRLMPNPFRNAFRLGLDFSATTTIGIDVFDVLGRKIQTVASERTFSQGKYAMKVNTEAWLPGTYFLRIKFEGKQLMYRLVKL